MKKITFLFAILLAMCGTAFGQTTPKLLWERQDLYLENDVPYTLLDVTASGKTIVTVLSGFTGQTMGYRIFDKDGNELNFPYGKVFSKLKRGNKVSWIATQDSLLIFDKELSLIKATKHLMTNILASTEVADGLIFHTEKTIYKYNFAGILLWQYNASQKIEGFANSKLALFRLEGGEYLYLDSFGKEKVKVPTMGASGAGFGGGALSVIKSPDAGFWLIGSKEVYRYDSTGLRTGYVDFVKEKIDSNPYFSQKGSIIANNNEEVNTNSIVLVHQKQDGFFLIKIDQSGQYQTLGFKDSNLFGAYEPSTYRIDDDRVMFQINANSGAKFIGFGNFKAANASWVKQIASTDYFSGFGGNVFSVLKEKPKVNPTDNPAFNEVIGYDLDGTIKWSFKDETIAYPQVIADFMYINHGLFYSKIRLNNGSLVWKKSKPANSHNAYHFFVNDKEGNDYWIYSKDYGVETKIDFISKSTLETSRFFEYPKNYYPLRSNYFIDFQNKTFTTITYGEDGTFATHRLRKYATKCFYPTNTSIEVTGATEVCSGTQVQLSIAQQEGSRYQWQKDGQDLANANSNVFKATLSGSYSVIIRDPLCQNSSILNPVKVTIKPTPEASITTDIKGTVYEPFKVRMNANTGTGLTYQWLRNDSLIASATSAIYEAQVSGDYRVKVTKEGCSQLSVPLKISIAIPLGTESDFGSEQVKIYPNPNQGDFTLILPNNFKNAEFQLFDSLGRSYPLTLNDNQIHTDMLSRGMYFLKITQGNRSVTRKVIIE